MFYVYEWFVKQTGEVFYVGKGCGRRYKVRKHNKFFNDFIKRHDCDSRIIKEFINEKDAFSYEYERIKELKFIGQCVCNIYDGGTGGTQSWWTNERKLEYSKKNIMKSEQQRKRMSENNPMKNPEIAAKTNAKKRKPIIVDGIYFESVKKAAEYIGTWDVYLTECLKHKNGLCKEHKCEYANQQPSQGNTDNSTLEGSTTND